MWPSDGPTDQPTDTARCRVACPRLKRRMTSFQTCSVNVRRKLDSQCNCKGGTKYEYERIFCWKVMCKSLFWASIKYQLTQSRVYFLSLFFSCLILLSILFYSCPPFFSFSFTQLLSSIALFSASLSLNQPCLFVRWLFGWLAHFSDWTIGLLLFLVFDHIWWFGLLFSFSIGSRGVVFFSSFFFYFVCLLVDFAHMPRLILSPFFASLLFFFFPLFYHWILFLPLSLDFFSMLFPSRFFFSVSYFLYGIHHHKLGWECLAVCLSFLSLAYTLIP